MEKIRCWMRCWMHLPRPYADDNTLYKTSENIDAAAETLRMSAEMSF